MSIRRNSILIILILLFLLTAKFVDAQQIIFGYPLGFAEMQIGNILMLPPLPFYEDHLCTEEKYLKDLKQFMIEHKQYKFELSLYYFYTHDSIKNKIYSKYRCSVLNGYLSSDTTLNNEVQFVCIPKGSSVPLVSYLYMDTLNDERKSFLLRQLNERLELTLRKRTQFNFDSIRDKRQRLILIDSCFDSGNSIRLKQASISKIAEICRYMSENKDSGISITLFIPDESQEGMLQIKNRVDKLKKFFGMWKINLSRTKWNIKVLKKDSDLSNQVDMLIVDF